MVRSRRFDRLKVKKNVDSRGGVMDRALKNGFDVDGRVDDVSMHLDAGFA